MPYSIGYIFIHHAFLDESYATLCSVFPDVSPAFLKEKAQQIGNDPDQLQAFIAKLLEEKSNFPSKKEYVRQQNKKSEEQKVRRMTPRDFVDQYEDPLAHFMDTKSSVNKLYKDHATSYITKHYPMLSESEIKKIMDDNNDHFLPSIKQVEVVSQDKKGKSRLKKAPDVPKEMDLLFLKEYVFFKLESRIKKLQLKEENKRAKALKTARKEGGLFECNVCFDSECLLVEMTMCEAGCMLCRDCVRRGVGVQIGDNKAKIECISGCGETLSTNVLKQVLPSLMYSKLIQRLQLEEIQAAGLEDLVQCPSCNFATIMPNKDDKLIICGNGDCGKVTCRLCGEENHLPLTCDEVEKDGEVAARTKVENAMTEAMIRACVRCQKRFFKDEGCNKMKCQCGQSMCYLCRKPVDNDYKHFYGQGASPIKGKCPLWSDNKNLHKAEVLKAADEAKKSVGSSNLKYDPTLKLEKPPEGFDPNALHNNFGRNGEYVEDEDDDSDADDDDDSDVDDDDDDLSGDEDEYWDYRRGRIIEDEWDEGGRLFEDEWDEDEEEIRYRPYDWA